MSLNLLEMRTFGYGKLLASLGGMIALGHKEWELAYSVAMRIVKNPSDAQDVAQETLLQAFRKSSSFQGRSRFSTWLYRIAVTQSLMFLRSSKRRGKLADAVFADIPEWLGGEKGDPSQQTDERRAFAQAATIAEGLGPIYREVFVLRFCEGRSEVEIARVLKIKKAAAKTRVYRVRHAIADELCGKNKLAA